MRAKTLQITGASIVYWAGCSGANERKHQSSASLPFVWGIDRWPVNSPHKGSVARKMIPCDAIWQIKANFGSGNSLLPDDIKQLPELMLIYHQGGSVALN